jgi:hypothetical protein
LESSNLIASILPFPTLLLFSLLFSIGIPAILIFFHIALLFRAGSKRKSYLEALAAVGKDFG